MRHPTEDQEPWGRQSILSYLDPSSNFSIDDPELRRELIHLFELIYRIELLARRKLSDPATGEDATMDSFTAGERAATGDFSSGEMPHTEVDIGKHIVAFDPAEFTEPPNTASPVTERRGRSGDQQAQEAGEQNQRVSDSGSDDQLQRWWVNFNGETNLERLARMRKVLAESPLTIEARFEEITEGLIILRVVTERQLTMVQVEWIVHLVMDSVGLDRNAAILSQN